MKRTFPVLLTLLVPAFVGHGQLVEYTGINAPIPDDNASGPMDQRMVSGVAAGFAALHVTLNLSGDGAPAFNGDLYATLSHNGQLVVLLNRPGRDAGLPLGYGDNGLSFTFDDSGSAPAAHTYRLSLSGPFPALGAVTGTVSTDSRLVDPDLVESSSAGSTKLSDFVGGDANGTWTLFLADLSSGGTARLDSWSLNFGVIPEPAELALASGLGLLGWAVRRKQGRKA
jgi:hypothetical protein